MCRQPTAKIHFPSLPSRHPSPPPVILFPFRSLSRLALFWKCVRQRQVCYDIFPRVIESSAKAEVEPVQESLQRFSTSRPVFALSKLFFWFTEKSFPATYVTQTSLYVSIFVQRYTCTAIVFGRRYCVTPKSCYTQVYLQHK